MTPFALERAIRRAIISGDARDNLDLAVEFDTTRQYVAKLRSRMRRERGHSEDIDETYYQTRPHIAAG